MNNFSQRAITGAVFVAVIVGAVWFHHLSFLALLLLIGIGGLYEFYKIVFGKRPGWIEWLFIFLACLIVPFYELWEWNGISMFGMSMAFSLGAIAVLLSRDKSIKRIAFLMAGLIYIPVPLALFYGQCFKIDYMINSSMTVYRPVLALNLFILIWSSDTFAYVCGRAFGKRKLFESISPKKTWEGFIGGAVLTIGVAFLLAYLWNIPYEVNIAVALCTVVFGTLGDLVESMIKREFNIKDSGNILPGHGGVLDRFDALLISLPFTSFCYFWMLS
jgi:phosphatidate cytidylyltransferase